MRTLHILVNGAERKQSWKAIPIKTLREDNGRRLLESDSPWLGSHGLSFRPRAIRALEPLLEIHGELLPLLCGEAEFRLYHPTQVLDALDENASSVARRIMRVERYVLRPDVLERVAIFMIPNLRVSPTFVDQRFVDLWRPAGLKGLEFSQIWAPN